MLVVTEVAVVVLVVVEVALLMVVDSLVCVLVMVVVPDVRVVVRVSDAVVV